MYLFLSAGTTWSKLPSSGVKKTWLMVWQFGQGTFTAVTALLAAFGDFHAHFTVTPVGSPHEQHVNSKITSRSNMTNP
jgi:hypothetical protein